MQVDLVEAAHHLEELVRAAQRGESVVIATPDGLVRLAPVESPAVEGAVAPVFGAMRGTVRVADDFDAPLDEFADYER